MSEDAHDSTSFYRCTCCGINDPRPGFRCDCADEACPICRKCCWCCLTPLSHGITVKICEARAKQGKKTQPILSFTDDDKSFLTLIGVAAEDDTRKAA